MRFGRHLHRGRDDAVLRVQVTLPGPDEEGEPDNPEPDNPNSPATGLPTVSGTPQVDQTLTADTSGISDQDGLTNVSYGYQWTAGGTDIEGATGASFTLTASQQGENDPGAGDLHRRRR